MIITASPHEALSHHLVATGADRMRHGAPQALYTAVAALTGLAEIRGSHATYSHLRPTRWRAWVVTSTHLAFVEFEFDGDDYDAQEEANRLDPAYRQSRAGERLVSAWARPLVTALRLMSGGIDRDHTTAGPTGAFRLNQIAVEFADGTTVPAEETETLLLPMHRAEGDSLRWDDFVAAVRAGSPYLTLELTADPPFQTPI